MPTNWGSDVGLTDPRSVNVTLQHSFIQMPENNYVPRFEDPRVGYFATQITDMTSADDPTPYRDMIHRWNLEKKNPGQARSEVIEPITWWIENTTPHEFREAIKEGVKQEIQTKRVLMHIGYYSNSNVNNKITLNQYSRLIKLLQDLHNDIDNIDSIDLDFIQNTIKIICEYGKIHPTQFVSSRAELVWWQLSNSPSQIKSSAQKEYYDLINGFRQWLGPNTSLTIDRETKEEYTWKEVIIFDDNVRENNKDKLTLLVLGGSTSDPLGVNYSGINGTWPEIFARNLELSEEILWSPVQIANTLPEVPVSYTHLTLPTSDLV